MRLPKTLALLLSMLSLPAYADTWLCISEQFASVTERDGTILGSQSYASNAKWLVDETGVRRFGEDKILVGPCKIYNNPDDPITPFISCKSEYGGVDEEFIMNLFSVFTLTGSGRNDDDEDFDFIIKGKCSKIEL